MIEASPKINIIFKFLTWQFFNVPKNIIKAFLNFLSFNFGFFSIGFHLKTLFSHWRKNKEEYGKAFDPKRWIFVLFSNLISRIIGAVIRTATIFVGLIIELFIFFVGIGAFLAWFLIPLIVIFGFWYGFKLLF